MDQDVRIEDYLNDKLQTQTDLASIDSLLEDLQKQHSLLSQQLDDAKSSLRSASTESQKHKQQLSQRTRAFQAQQSDIDRRMRIATQSETSDEAVPKFEAGMAALQRLEVARRYMDLLRHVEDLSSEARRNFSKSPQAALKPYISLQNLANDLRAAQPAAEDAAPHLIDHIGNSARTLWKQMKDAFASDFEKTLAKLKWPGKDIVLQGKLQVEWTEGVKKLLDLQGPELSAREGIDLDKTSSNEPLVLLPLEVMVRPLELRFRYHFEGDRPTNKLDKPEYFLSHFEDTLGTYEDFFTKYLQPILWAHFKRQNLTPRSVYFDSTSALITAMLPMLRHKIFSTVSSVSKQPHLFSHFIHELMVFDVRLRAEWGYDAGITTQEWKGLTWEVLVKKGWFDKWLSVEKDFALARYKDIINAPESHEIDYDSVDGSATKPTYAAIRVNDLLETITNRYRPLTSFSQKLQFLIGIQIEIFDLYHSRLFESLSKYQVSTSSIGRTIQGDSRETAAEVTGLKGIEHLCRIYGSAEYLEKKMRDWSDDVFFVQLYAELQERVNNRYSNRPLSSGGGAGSDNKSNAFAGSLTVEAVAERTSSTIAPSTTPAQDADTDDPTVTGALFDETASSYKRLRIRTESVLTETLVSAIRDSLRTYTRINPWSSLPTNPSSPPSSSVTSASQLAPTPELDALLQTLTAYLPFLSRALALAPLRRLGRQMALTVQTTLWDTVLMRHMFSTAGIAQFERDVDVISAALDRYLGRDQAELGLRRLVDALVLMKLPPRTSPLLRRAGDERSEMEDDDDEDEDVGAAWDAVVDNKVQEREQGLADADRQDEGEKTGLGLWDVEQRVFLNNESAREVLEDLGLETLSESDARRVLERIVRIGGPMR